MREVVMPRLGLTQETSLVIEWKKALGDQVRRGEILMLVETDKSIVEIEADTDGVLEQKLVQEGQEVPVFTPIALLREA